MYLGESLSLVFSPCSPNKEAFLKGIVIKIKEISNKTAARKKRGWYTVEGMRTILKWSKTGPQLNSSLCMYAHACMQTCVCMTPRDDTYAKEQRYTHNAQA